MCKYGKDLLKGMGILLNKYFCVLMCTNRAIQVIKIKVFFMERLKCHFQSILEVPINTFKRIR